MKDLQYYNRLKAIQEDIMVSPYLKEDLKDFIKNWDTYYNIKVITYDIKTSNSYNEYRREFLNYIEEYLYKLFKKDKYKLICRDYKVSHEEYQQYPKDKLNGPFLYINYPYSGINLRGNIKSFQIAEININIFNAPRVIKKIIEFTKNHSKLKIEVGYSTERDLIQGIIDIENGEVISSKIKDTSYEVLKCSLNGEELIDFLAKELKKDNPNNPIIVKTECTDALGSRIYLVSKSILPVVAGYLCTKDFEKPIELNGERFMQELYIYHHVMYHKLDWLMMNFKRKLS